MDGTWGMIGQLMEGMSVIGWMIYSLSIWLDWSSGFSRPIFEYLQIESFLKIICGACLNKAYNILNSSDICIVQILKYVMFYVTWLREDNYHNEPLILFWLISGAYYCLNMIMITLSTFLAVIVIHLYFRGDRTNRVPTWLRKVWPAVSLKALSPKIISISIFEVAIYSITLNLAKRHNSFSEE